MLADRSKCQFFSKHWCSRVLGQVCSAAPENIVDYGLFWITSVGLLPRQQQLEETRLPSRVGFCSNQGHGNKKQTNKTGHYDRFFIFAGIIYTWHVYALQILAFLNGLCTCGAYSIACFSKKRENVQTLSTIDKKKTWWIYRTLTWAHFSKCNSFPSCTPICAVCLIITACSGTSLHKHMIMTMMQQNELLLYN